MNFASAIRAAAVCLVLAALGLVWHGCHSAAQAKASLAIAASKRVSLEAALVKTRERIAARKRATATPGSSGGLSPARRSGPAASHRDPAESSAAGQNFASLLEVNPKLLDLYLKNFHANLADRFEPVCEKIGLTREQIDRFEDLATAHEQENMDLRAAAAAQGLPMTDPGIVALHQQSNQQYQAALVAALGAPASQQLAQSPVVSPTTQAVMSSLANLLALSATPLTYGESEQLAPILASAGANSSNGSGLASIDWNKVSTQAAGILPGAQLQALQTMSSLMQVSALVRQYYSQPAMAK